MSSTRTKHLLHLSCTFVNMADKTYVSKEEQTTVFRQLRAKAGNQVRGLAEGLDSDDRFGIRDSSHRPHRVPSAADMLRLWCSKPIMGVCDVWDLHVS